MQQDHGNSQAFCWAKQTRLKRAPPGMVLIFIFLNISLLFFVLNFYFIAMIILLAKNAF